MPGFIGSALLFAVACGGKVVVDAGGVVGSGGSGGSGNGGSTGDVLPSVVSSSSGGPDLCADVCAKLEQSGCPADTSCVDDCFQSYADAGPCVPQLDAYVQCVLAHGLANCDAVECAGEAKAFAACISPAQSCSDQSCAGGGGSCACKAVCGGVPLEVDCLPGDATDFCTCLQGGMVVGKCTESQVNGTSCDIAKGCCAAKFFP